MADHRAKLRTFLCAALFPVALVAILSLAVPAAACADDHGHDPVAEAAAIIDALGAGPGSRIADVGAGDGEWSAPIAQAIGPKGHLWATEVTASNVSKLERELAKGGTGNFTVVKGDQDSIRLPTGCCDAILLRVVYHHFEKPEIMRADLLQALRPGGRLVVVETQPSARRERGTHSIDIDTLVDELERDGFEEIERLEDWYDKGDYCVVFRKAGV